MAENMAGSLNSLGTNLPAYQYYIPNSVSDDEDNEDFPEEFVRPQDDILGLGDFMKEGEERLCIITGVISPSEIYVTLSKYFPKKVDGFIQRMSRKYTEMAQGPQRYRWIAKVDKLVPGMIVGVYKEDGKEWLRGRIVEHIQVLPENRFLVQLIDLGESYDFPVGNIVYLHKDFVDQVRFAIKCRLSLSKFYDKYHVGECTWDDNVKLNTSLLFEKRVRVKFIRQVTHNSKLGELAWEVSLLELKDDHPHYLVGGSPIEKQMIKLSTGSYFGNDGKEEMVAVEAKLQ